MTPDPKKKRIALKRNSVAWKKLVKEVFERDGYHCQKCKNIFPHNMLAPSHIKSVGAGGDDTAENLEACCQFCHHELHKANIS